LIKTILAIAIQLTISLPWWTGLVLIGIPIIYLIGMTIASVFLFRWFRKRREEQENQKLEKLFLTSYTSWILFFILLPVTLAIWFYIYSSALFFIIPSITFALFIIFLLIFYSKLKKSKETATVEPVEN